MARPPAALLLLLASAWLLAAAAQAQAQEQAPAGGLVLPLKRRDGVSRARGLLRNATLPLHGAVKDYGYFYATLLLGTPQRTFAVIVDTGSTITYVPCASCGSNCGTHHKDEAFDPAASSSAAQLACGDAKCACGRPACGCSPAQECTYSRTYAEQSSSSGLLMQDVMALGPGEGVPVVFGCETRETGEIFNQEADGILGLGNSDVSIVNQLAGSGAIDNVFSLCFGSVEGDGALLLGDVALPPGVAAGLAYTPLLASGAHPHYYLVGLEAISVADAPLAVEQGTYVEGYGTVLDSGTTFTYLPTAAFTAFVSRVSEYATAKGLQIVPGPDPKYKDVCFGGAPPPDALAQLAGVFPDMTLHFPQGVTLRLGPLNYLFVHSGQAGAYCMGVFDNGRQGTLLGGITFRNVLVQYDRRNARVGFAPAPCQQLGLLEPCADEDAERVGAACHRRRGAWHHHHQPHAPTPPPTHHRQRRRRRRLQRWA